jgi:hypothetical protein
LNAWLFYGFQAAQMNKEPPQKSSLDLTLTHYLHDGNLEPREVCLCFEFEPLRTWCYHIFLNFCTLFILL